VSFAKDLRAFTVKVEARTQAALVGIAEEVQRSIVEGSEITGAPGQPVATGHLKASWQLTFPTPTSAQVSTNVEYAWFVENAIGPHGPRSYGADRGVTYNAKGLPDLVGGSHSVAHTRAGIQRIVDHVIARLRG
jgi:hypothetical protein